jgi:hypothetical protein
LAINAYPNTIFNEEVALVKLELVHKTGLDIQLPEGKLPGFYAQIIKGIAQSAPLFDRYKELLILESEETLPLAIKVLEHYRVPSIRCDLLLLPEAGVEKEELYEDYVIVTRSDNHYVDLALIAVFCLHWAKPEAEPAPALLQLKEHLIGSINKVSAATLYLMDRQLMELAERIAKAYGCEVKWKY